MFKKTGLRRVLVCSAAAVLAGAALAHWSYAARGDAKQWAVHDESRPHPRVITPGTESTEDRPGNPPSDAIILFDGNDLSKWKTAKDGGAPAWKEEDGVLG